MLSAFILLNVMEGLIGGGEKADHIIKAILFWNLWSFISTEILSELNALDKRGIFFCWLLLDAFLLFIIIRKMKFQERNTQILKGRGQKGDKNWIISVLALAGMSVMVLSILTVPYNSDSMTYHLPRIAHWAQNRTVAHYAANDVRQIASPVLAEFINVQVYILSGNKDYFLNLLQAGSYITDAYLVYVLSEKIGCSKKFALLAVLLFMTMPIAFGEALSTQVDLFSTIWMLIFVFYFLDVYEQNEIIFSREIIVKCMGMAVAIALGYLAKPSVNIGMAIFLFILFIHCINKKACWRDLAKIVLCIIPIILFLLFPELLRNIYTFNALSDPSVGEKQLVGTLRPNYLLVNMIKNFAYNWPNIYLYDSAKWMGEIVGIVAESFRVDLNDMSIAEHGVEYVMHQAPSYGHDTATNPLVIFLATISFLWNIIQIRKERRIGSEYSAWVMVTFIIFCIVVRWEPYVTRYMLAYLALLCPMISWQLQSMTAKTKVEGLQAAGVSIIYFLCITELFSLIRYHTELWQHEVSERPKGYFAQSRGIEGDYYEILDYIQTNGYKNIGIKMNGGWEYPLWAETGGEDIRIENVMVENLTSRYMDDTFVPDCVVASEYLEEDVIVIKDIKYKKVDLAVGSELGVYYRD